MIVGETTIRRYTPEDEKSLFDLIEHKGGDWVGYLEKWEKYRKALENSITYLIYDSGTLCGYARCRSDDGFGVYVYDLLVDKDYRGKEYGRLLMEQACRDYPDEPVYVMSDVDPYYSKLGYEKEGTVFVIKIRE